MDCSIVGANQRDVRVVVAGDILDLIKADKPIDVKALSLNMYNAMYEAKEKNNPTRASTVQAKLLALRIRFPANTMGRLIRKLNFNA